MRQKINYIKSLIFSYSFTVLISSFLITTLGGCENTTSANNPDAATLSRLPLNDTGTIRYTTTFLQGTSDPAIENLLSPAPDAFAPGQDADYGRDVTDNNNVDGIYGFQFVKLDENGQPLANQSAIYSETPWSCVEDRVTGLIWEVKTSEGLRWGLYTYSWYEPDNKLNGGFAGGFGQPVKCGSFLASCDTHSYKQAVNTLNNGKGLCGLTNWRLPLREELRSIVHYGSITGTTIDSNYFPNTSNSDTWTSQTSLYRNTDGSEAWEIHFNTGYSESHEKTEENVHIRLVHNPLN